MLGELRLAARRLAADRWSTAAAVISAVAGIGLSVAVFAVAYGVLLRPMPYSDPGRLMVLDLSVKARSLQSWITALPSFPQLSGYSREGLTLRTSEDSRFVLTAVVGDRFFETLRPSTVVGRTLTAADGNSAMVVSERFARGVAGSAAAMLGRTVSLGPTTLTVVGVLPAGTTFPDDGVDAWIPWAAPGAIAFDRSSDERLLHLIGRLQDDVSLSQARVEVEAARARLEPRSHRDSAVPIVAPLQDTVVRRVRPAIGVFAAGAALVLLIACANIATILIGRTLARRRELAIRAALGAGRRDLLATTLAESVLIALAGSAIGLAAVAMALRVFVRWGEGLLPRLADVRVDGPILAFALALTVLAALAAVGPALSAVAPVAALLRTTGGMSPRGGAVRAALSAFQIALAVLLLSGGVLLGRTVVALLGNDTGIDPGGSLITQVMLTDSMTFGAAAQRPWLEQLLERIRSAPGVTAAGVGSSLPPANSTLVMTVSTDTGNGLTESPELTFAAVSPGYLEAIGARLKSGRLFEARDDTRGDLVVVLSESARRILLPEGSAAGHQLRVTLPGMKPRGLAAVLGTIGDVKYDGLEAARGPAVYVLWRELPASQLYLAVRTAGDPRLVAARLRELIRTFDPARPAMPIRPLTEVMTRSITDRRVRAWLGAGVAGLALLIALAGLAGGLGRFVAERRRELAIRAALGATPARAAATVFRGATLIIGGGVAAGIGAAWCAGSVLRAFVYGVSAHDPWTLILVGAATAAASFLVCAIPARQALVAANPLELMREN